MSYTDLNKDEDSLQYTRHAMQIAQLIDHVIKDKKMSKGEFANRIGKRQAEISKWLSGNQNFTLKTLSKIENALGVEIVKMFSREELGLKGKPISRNAEKDMTVVFRGTSTESFVSSGGYNVLELVAPDSGISEPEKAMAS